MIKMKLTNNPGYPTTQPEYFGTIRHTINGVTASVNCDYASTLPVRRYLCGLEPRNYPVPALLIKFEYSPRSEDDSYYNRGLWHGMDHHRPGQWREFLNVTENFPLPVKWVPQNRPLDFWFLCWTLS